MNLSLLAICWVLGVTDIQEAVKAAAQHSTVILPPTTQALPEDTAWQMIYTEGGVLAVVLALGVVILWRLVSRILDETRAQNEQLMGSQVAAINRLSETMSQVQLAVQLSDVHNQTAVGKLTDSVNAATARIDRAEAELKAASTGLLDHSHRIQILESGSHLILPPGGRPTTSPRNKKP